MTYEGQLLIDLFALSLDSRRPKKDKGVIPDRYSEILKRCYNFEENTFDGFGIIAKCLNRSTERIRQIHHKGLRRIRIAGKTLPDNHFCSKLIKHVNESVENTEGENIHYKIVNFWNNNLPEYSGKIVICLISHLFHPKSSDVTYTLKYYFKWKNGKGKETQRKENEVVRKEKELNKTVEKQNKLLKETIWFEEQIKWGDFGALNFSPKREVNHKSEYNSGIFQSRKCNSFVQYESSLELKFIKQLESFPRVKHYTEQPVKIVCRTKNKTFEYTPDFAVLLDTDEIILVEIKNFAGMVDARVHNKIEAMIDYCKENGLGLLLTDGNKSINEILNYDHKKAFEKELEIRLNERNGRTMFFAEFQDLRDRYSATMMDLYSIVLKNNWSLYPFLFKLSNKNPYQKFRKTMIKNYP